MSRPPKDPPRPPPDYEEQSKSLRALQDASEKMANEIARDALAHIMAMGHTFDAAIIEITDNDTGKVVERRAKFIVRPVSLKEWEQIQKEQLRSQLGGNKGSGIIIP